MNVSITVDKYNTAFNMDVYLDAIITEVKYDAAHNKYMYLDKISNEDKVNDDKFNKATATN